MAPEPMCSPDEPGLEGAMAAALVHLSDRCELPDSVATRGTSCRVSVGDRRVELRASPESWVLGACSFESSTEEPCLPPVSLGKPGAPSYDFSDDLPVQGFEGPQALVWLDGGCQADLTMGFTDRWLVLAERACESRAPHD